MDALNISKFCDFILGKTDKYVPKAISEDPVKKEKEKEGKALEVLNFFITEYMGWRPQEAAYHLTNDIIDCFNLREVFRYIIIDDNMRKIYKDKPISDVTITYILSKVFKGIITINNEDVVIDVWTAVKNGDTGKWPSKFFSDDNGKERMMIIIKEFIRTKVSVKEEDLYKEFSKSAEMNNKLRDEKLFHVLSPYYVQPIDLLHEYMSREGRADNFLYSIYKYDNIIPATVPAKCM